MFDPFSLLPLALTARGGRVDDFEVQQLVAAGLTLLQRSAPLVRALSGKRAAILLPTSPAFFTALAAAEGRGSVLINTLAAPAEISHQITDSNVGAVFTTVALAPALPQGIPLVLLDEAPRLARVVVDGITREVDLGSHRGMTIEGDSDSPGRDDEATIVYTSAMAGVPLGAILSHRNLLANARATIEAAGNTSDDRVLAVLPYSHLFGLTVTGAAPLLAGARLVTMPRFNPARAAELLATGEITEIASVPAVYRSLLAALARRGDAKPVTGSLRVAICGGSPLSATLQDQWFEATGVELRQGYGLTEAGPVCAFNRVDQPNARGTLGVPYPGMEIDLRAPIAYDEDGRPNPLNLDGHRDDSGEICVRGDGVFQGYVSGGENGLPLREGWLHTGDLGRRDSSGRIEFTGLVKPMFTRNGFNIYPRELERVVVEMPGIESATIRESPVPEREPDIVLDVRGNVDVEDVKRWCSERLAGYKQPTVVRVEG